MMYEHQLVAHQRHGQSRSGGELLWALYTLQMYFTAKGLIDYFIVTNDDTKDIPSEDNQREGFSPNYSNRVKPLVLLVLVLSVAS
jgi:Ca2+/H+ antiporter